MFCLTEAPTAGAEAAVRREGHGLFADRIFKVQEGN